MSTHAETGPKVVCIAGSPRRHGNSDRLLEALERGVVEAGGEAAASRREREQIAAGPVGAHDGRQHAPRYITGLEDESACAVAEHIAAARIPNVAEKMRFIGLLGLIRK